MMRENLITREELKQELIPLNQLHPSSLNTYSVDDVNDLKSSILATGFTSALTVAKAEDGYEVLSGNRRLHAVTQLNAEGKTDYKELPCLVIDVEGLDDDQKLLEIELANLTSRTLDVEEENRHRFKVIDALKKVLDKQGVVKQKYFADLISKAFGMDARYARMYRIIFEEGGEEIRKAAENGEASISDLATLAHMDDETKEKTIQKIHEMAEEDKKTSKAKARELISEINQPSAQLDLFTDDFIDEMYSSDEDDFSTSASGHAFSFYTFREQAELLLDSDISGGEKDEIVSLCQRILDHLSYY